MIRKNRVKKKNTNSLEPNEIKEMLETFQLNQPHQTFPLSKVGLFRDRKKVMKLMTQRMNDANMNSMVKLKDDKKVVDDMRIPNLEEENKALLSRCKKLESQNIIATAQIVDYVSIVMGAFFCAVTYISYIKLIWILSKLFLEKQNFIILSTIRVILILIPYINNKIFYGMTYRRFQVFAVAFIMIARIKMTRWRIDKYIEEDSNLKQEQLSAIRDDTAPSYFGDGITEDDIWDGVYEINARFLYSSILRLRGLWTKTAQYLSSRADFVPVPYVRELSKLMDSSTPTEWIHVEKMLKQAGILDKFSYVEQEPIASASIGQVHIATLKESDEKVVIKVQHPHAQDLLSDDFVSLNIIAKIVTILEPEYEFFAILMKEWANESKKELDFRIEVNNLELACKSIENMKKSNNMMTTQNGSDSVPFSVEIPQPYQMLSSKRVMVMSFCDGKRIDDVEQLKLCNASREAVLNAVSQIFAHQMYVSDIFNGDPHPGNILIRPGISKSETKGFCIVVLDWGLAKRLPVSKRIGFCQMVYAASTFDFGLMMDGFKTLGLELKRENVSEDMEGVRFLLRDMVPRSVARRRIKAKMKTDKKRMDGKKKGEKVPIKSKAYPGEFFFFVRTNELLHGLGSRLGVELKYLDILQPYAKKGFKNSYQYCTPDKLDPIYSDIIHDLNLNHKIDEILQTMEVANDIIGAQVCVIDKNSKILSHNIKGNLGSIKSHLKMRSDSLIHGFSVTKAITATLAHRMVQEGYMSYDEPICERIWPEFCPTIEVPQEMLEYSSNDERFKSIRQRWNWKRSITLRHILSHTSGLWTANPGKLTIKQLGSCETCIKAYEYNKDCPGDNLFPSTEPGSELIYHYLSFGWLVAGCCRGAYNLRHIGSLTYREVFQMFRSTIISSEVNEAGFNPLGGEDLESHDIAYNHANVDMNRMIQMRKEAESMGESLQSPLTNEMKGSNDADKASRMKKELMDGIEGMEFMIDPRIWNSNDAVKANVPAAGGRFSAKGLALFYHELGLAKILSQKCLNDATQTVRNLNSNQLNIFNPTTHNDAKDQVTFGLGYNIMNFTNNSKNSKAFGHGGVGGSIGLHHIPSGTSVAIMFNKADGGENLAQNILKIISSHLNW